MTDELDRLVKEFGDGLEGVTPGYIRLLLDAIDRLREENERLEQKCDAHLSATQLAWNERDGEKRSRLHLEALLKEAGEVVEEAKKRLALYAQPKVAHWETLTYEQMDTFLAKLKGYENAGH